MQVDEQHRTRTVRTGVTGCCVGGDGDDRDRAQNAPGTLTRTQRRARAFAGLGFLALGGGLAFGGFALEGVAAGALGVLICAVPCVLALVAGWFGISHVVAGITGYVGCPELGAIPSLVLRRHVTTRCAPWDRIDGRLEKAGRNCKL